MQSERGDKMKKYTYFEWIQEGQKRFGEDFKKWKFVCPACGHIQSVEDFVNLGLDPNSAFQECIGRHNGNAKPANKHSVNGCDWCSYGLFGTLGKGILVHLESGEQTEIFDFAQAEREES